MPRYPVKMRLLIFPGEGGAPASCPSLLARPCPNRQERTAPGLAYHAICLGQAERREKACLGVWSSIPEGWIPVTAEICVEFTESSPVLEVKRTGAEEDPDLQRLSYSGCNSASTRKERPQRLDGGR